MKSRIIVLGALTMLFVNSCGVNDSDFNNVLSQLDSLKTVIGQYEKKCAELRDSVSILKFPADQRYNQIVTLVKGDHFEEARAAIDDLLMVFPESKEAGLTSEQLAMIEKREAEKKAEEERIKALGFKVFKDQSAVTIGNKTCSFSGFSYGRTFTFDYVSDVGEYCYRTADKDNTFILASMSMSTKEHYASTPSIGVYKIEDGALKLVTTFDDEYASWNTYGAYIGNYSETSHDFAKVSTIRYKIAAEISNEESKIPLVILCEKDGKYPGNDLTIEQVRDNCIVIKILNRNKI